MAGRGRGAAGAGLRDRTRGRRGRGARHRARRGLADRRADGGRQVSARRAARRLDGGRPARAGRRGHGGGPGLEPAARRCRDPATGSGHGRRRCHGDPRQRGGLFVCGPGGCRRGPTDRGRRSSAAARLVWRAGDAAGTRALPRGHGRPPLRRRRRRSGDPDRRVARRRGGHGPRCRLGAGGRNAGVVRRPDRLLARRRPARRPHARGHLPALPGRSVGPDQAAPRGLLGMGRRPRRGRFRGRGRDRPRRAVAVACRRAGRAARCPRHRWSTSPRGHLAAGRRRPGARIAARIPRSGRRAEPRRRCCECRRARRGPGTHAPLEGAVQRLDPRPPGARSGRSAADRGCAADVAGRRGLSGRRRPGGDAHVDARPRRAGRRSGRTARPARGTAGRKGQRPRGGHAGGAGGGRAVQGAGGRDGAGDHPAREAGLAGRGTDARDRGGGRSFGSGGGRARCPTARRCGRRPPARTARRRGARRLRRPARPVRRRPVAPRGGWRGTGRHRVRARRRSRPLARPPGGLPARGRGERGRRRGKHRGLGDARRPRRGLADDAGSLRTREARRPRGHRRDPRAAGRRLGRRLLPPAGPPLRHRGR